MNDLIKALKIFQKYIDPDGTEGIDAKIELECLIIELNPEDVSDEDHAELISMGFEQEYDYYLFDTSS